MEEFFCTRAVGVVRAGGGSRIPGEAGARTLSGVPQCHGGTLTVILAEDLQRPLSYSSATIMTFTAAKNMK